MPFTFASTSHTNTCSLPPSSKRTEQQTTITIPGTNISIPISALAPNQPVISNISIPGIQIPTSQAISIPGIQIPTSQAISISGGTGVQVTPVQIAQAPTSTASDSKQETKENKTPSSPTGQGSSQGNILDQRNFLFLILYKQEFFKFSIYRNIVFSVI